MPKNNNMTLGTLGQRKVGNGPVGSTRYIPPIVMMNDSDQNISERDKLGIAIVGNPNPGNNRRGKQIP